MSDVSGLRMQLVNLRFAILVTFAECNNEKNVNFIISKTFVFQIVSWDVRQMSNEFITQLSGILLFCERFDESHAIFIEKRIWIPMRKHRQ